MRKIKSPVTRVGRFHHFSCLTILLFILTVSVSQAQTIHTSIDYNTNGKARYIKGDLDGAMADFNKAIEINPRYAVAYNNRGLVRQDKEDLDGAFADFSKAIEINPLLAEAYNSRGVVWSFKGDMEKAVSDFDAAIKLDSRCAMAYANRGLMRLLQGKDSIARKDFRQCLKLDDSLRDSLDDHVEQIERMLQSKNGSKTNFPQLPPPDVSSRLLLRKDHGR